MNKRRAKLLPGVPTIQAVEQAIHVPAKKWKGRCHEIAALCLEAGLVKGKLRYGHYLGPVSSKCRKFYRMYKEVGVITHHGWIEVRRGVVWDPTRWYFEGVAPYVYCGSAEYYDVGGNLLRAALRISASSESPAPPGGEKIIDNPFDEMTREYLEVMHGYKFPLTIADIFRIANTPWMEFGLFAKIIYTELEKAGHKAKIPFDNYDYVMDDDFDPLAEIADRSGEMEPEPEDYDEEFWGDL